MNSPSMDSKSTRRRFLQQGTLAASSVLGFPSILRSANPNSQLQVAAIGVGGMGGVTLKQIAAHPKVFITGLCDVEKGTLERASRSFPESVSHADWRELLSKHSDRFDAVTIGIPDHMHAAPAVTVLRARKHLYLQKPMAPTPHECRVITREAAKADVVTQLGNQGRSSIESRTAVKLIQDGAIGRIREVVIWENKSLNWWPKNTRIEGKADSIPEGFDWDLWQGVRESRSYFANTYHPKNWRAWFDFGVGEMGDMGCHHFDPTFDALNLTAPLRVRQTSPGSSGPLWGKRRQVELIFPGSDITEGGEVKVTWHDGDLRPDASRISLPSGVDQLVESGTCWIGEKGQIYKNYRKGMPVVLPEDGFPAEKYPRDFAQQNHYHDWVDAIIEGRKSCADFSHGGPLTESVLVGSLADRFAQQWMNWDSANLNFTTHPEAASLVKRPYRDGWKVPGLG